MRRNDIVTFVFDPRKLICFNQLDIDKRSKTSTASEIMKRQTHLCNYNSDFYFIFSFCRPKMPKLSKLFAKLPVIYSGKMSINSSTSPMSFSIKIFICLMPQIDMD